MEASRNRCIRGQAIGAIALAELRKLGVSQRRIRAAAGALPASVDDCGWLAFDGWMMYALPGAEEVLNLMEKKPRSARVFRVAPLAQRLVQ
jgi:hypothetical protein